MSYPRFASLLGTIMLITGCAGERPTVTPQQGPAQIVATDPAVIAVSGLLDRPAPEFTAEYTIQPTAEGSGEATAVVSRSADVEHVQVGDVDIFVGPDEEITCSGNRQVCLPGVNESYLSNLSLTRSFWAASSNQRLLNDASRKIGTPTARNETIADQPATCVDIPVAGPTAGGSVTYCATDAGVLARYIGADTTIELTRFSTTVDTAALTPPTTSTPG